MPLAENRHYTLADILGWDEKERYELIDGEPVMLATPLRIHQKIVSEFNRQLGNFLEGKKCQVYPAPFAVRLFEGAGDLPENTDTMVEPDITVVCDPEKLDDIGCKGAPDFILEVLSPSSQRHDRLVKFNLYQTAGVREYWIADPANRIVQTFLLENGTFTVKELGLADSILRVNVLDGCYIDLSKVFSE